MGRFLRIGRTTPKLTDERSTQTFRTLGPGAGRDGLRQRLYSASIQQRKRGPDSTTLVVAQTMALVVTSSALLLRAANPFLVGFERGKARTSAILNTAADGILTIGADGSIETFNLAAARLFGIAVQHAVGKRADQLFVLPKVDADLPFPPNLHSRALAT